jgi:hypothetical protein
LTLALASLIASQSQYWHLTLFGTLWDIRDLSITSAYVKSAFLPEIDVPSCNDSAATGIKNTPAFVKHSGAGAVPKSVMSLPDSSHG